MKKLELSRRELMYVRLVVRKHVRENPKSVAIQTLTEVIKKIQEIEKELV